MTDVTLATNPFYILNVSTRDARDRIVEAAETASLLADGPLVQHARSELTVPRKRLAAEVSWLPGVAPSRARALVEANKPGSSAYSDLRGVARGNVLADLMSDEVPAAPERIGELLRSLFSVDLEVDASSLLKTINEDREVAGFPLATDEAAAMAIYGAQRNRWIRAAIAMIDRTPAPVFADGLYDLFDDVPQTALTDEFIEAYRLGVAWFLDDEATRARALCERAVGLAPTAPHAIEPLFDKLDELLVTWERASRPIQVNLAARGLVEEKSEGLALTIRDCGITLFNKHALLDHANRLNRMIDKYFAEIPEVAAVASEDAEVLDDLVLKRAEQTAADARFAAEMRYSAEIGTIFRKRIQMDAEKISYEGLTVLFANVKGIRWGAIRKSVNGVPTGTDYLVALRDDTSNIHIEFGNGTLFENLISRLWRVAVTKLMLDFLTRLLEGKRIQVGPVLVTDETVSFAYAKGWGRSEQVELNWSDCQVWTENGMFVIGHSAEKKVQAALSYRDDENVHVLEHMVRAAFKNGAGRLSDFIARNDA